MSAENCTNTGTKFLFFFVQVAVLIVIIISICAVFFYENMTSFTPIDNMGGINGPWTLFQKVVEKYLELKDF